MDAYMREQKPIALEFFGPEPPASTLVEGGRLVKREWLVGVQADAVGA